MKRSRSLGVILLRGLADQAVHFLLADLDAVGGADFRQQQAKAHAAHGDVAIIGGFAFDLLQRGVGIFLMARFVAKLAHDVLIFGLDHRRRHFEVMALGQLVEQAALHVRAGEVVEFLLLLVADQALQLVEVLEAELRGEFVVDLGLAGGLDRLDDDVERRGLALQIGGLVIRRGRSR